MHFRVVLVEGDVQRLVVTCGEGAGNRLGYVDGLIGGLRPDAKSVRSGRNLQRFGLSALHALEDNEVLLSSSMQRSHEGEIVVNPNPQCGLLELMLYVDFDGGLRSDWLNRGVRVGGRMVLFGASKKLLLRLRP